MKLITVENFELKVADEALLVRPIRRLWNADRTGRKESFYQQMSYLYFMVSPASSYSYILNEKERHDAIVEQEALPKDFKPSDYLKEAMEIYKKLTVTPSQKLLTSALKAANTVSKFLEDETILEQTDDKGRPKYQISSITAALKNVEGIVASLQNLQKKVEQELADNEGKARGTQELTVGDIGLD
jgi:rubrerythrin